MMESLFCLNLVPLVSLFFVIYRFLMVCWESESVQEGGSLVCSNREESCQFVLE